MSFSFNMQLKNHQYGCQFDHPYQIYNQALHPLIQPCMDHNLTIVNTLQVTTFYVNATLTLSHQLKFYDYKGDKK